MDALGSEDVGPDCLVNWHQCCRCGADPVGQRRHIEIDAFPRVYVALAVEWQVQAVFGEQHVCQQLGAGAATRDWMRGRWRLRYRLAGPAGELLPNVLDHLPLARNKLSVSVTSSPILRNLASPQHGQVDGAG